MDDKKITVRELEDFFRSADMPKVPFYLNPSCRVNDLKFFLDTHFVPLRNKDLPFDLLHRPLYDRLVELKNLITKKN